MRSRTSAPAPAAAVGEGEGEGESESERSRGGRQGRSPAETQNTRNQRKTRGRGAARRRRRTDGGRQPDKVGRTAFTERACDWAAVPAGRARTGRANALGTSPRRPARTNAAVPSGKTRLTLKHVALPPRPGLASPAERLATLVVPKLSGTAKRHRGSDKFEHHPCTMRRCNFAIARVETAPYHRRGADIVRHQEAAQRRDVGRCDARPDRPERAERAERPREGPQRAQPARRDHAGKSRLQK